jgi:hypothetical protein
MDPGDGPLSLMRALLLALLALGCAPSFEREPVWLPAGHPLAVAQAAWGLPLPMMPVLDESHTAAELVAICDAERPEAERPATVDACSEPVWGHVWVASDLTPARRAVARVHELGHILAGWERSGEHLGGAGCEGPVAKHTDLMCVGGAMDPQPTPRDFDFVLHLDG